MKIKAIFARAAGGTVETDLRPYRKILHGILGRRLDGESDAGLKEASGRMGGRIRAGGPGSDPPRPEDAIEAFALVREASRRTLGLDPFDVQMIAGLAMASGRIAERTAVAPCAAG